MKVSLFTLLFSLTILNCLSQSLEGEWNGSYNYYNPGSKLTNPASIQPFKLKIELNSDSSYNIISFSGRGVDTSSCVMLYKKSGKDSLYLEEVRFLSSSGKSTYGMQVMYLKIIDRKKTIYLEGIWRFKSEYDFEGEVYLYKKK